MTIRVVIGTILVAVTMIIVAFVVVNEPVRMTEFDSGYRGRSIEAGATLYATNCTGCHGAEGEGLPGIGPALNARDLFDGTRLKEIGWSGTVADFVKATIASGRPRASAAFSAYPQRMPTWSQEFGGPLRPDQVLNIADFVLNWQNTALAQPTQPAVTATPNPNAVGTDLDVELPKGDPAQGELLFTGKVNGQYPCYACHSLQPGQTLVGPSLAGIATTAATRKEDYSAEMYIHESIVLPNAFVVEGFAPGLMPQTFPAQMDKQQLADIIAFLMTQE